MRKRSSPPCRWVGVDQPGPSVPVTAPYKLSFFIACKILCRASGRKVACASVASASICCEYVRNAASNDADRGKMAAKTANEQVESQADALPKRQLAIERFGEQSCGLFATEHGHLACSLFPASLQALGQLQSGDGAKGPKGSTWRFPIPYRFLRFPPRRVPAARKRRPAAAAVWRGNRGRPPRTPPVPASRSAGRRGTEDRPSSGRKRQRANRPSPRPIRSRAGRNTVTAADVIDDLTFEDAQQPGPFGPFPAYWPAARSPATKVSWTTSSAASLSRSRDRASGRDNRRIVATTLLALWQFSAGRKGLP